MKKNNVSYKEFFSAFLIVLISFFLIFYNYIFRISYVKKEPIKLYFADHISPTYKEIIDDFNKAYKDEIEVIPVHIPFEKFSTNDRKELLTRYLRNKSDRIDVFSVDVIWTKRFSKWAAIFDENLANYLKDSLVSEALKSCVFDDKAIAAPIFIDIGVMYYKESVVYKSKKKEEYLGKIASSITFEDMANLKKELNLDDNVYIFPASDYEGLICSFYELYASELDGKVSTTKFVFNQKAFQNSYKFLFDCFNYKNISPSKALNFRETESLDYFLKGNGVFLRSWPGLLRNARGLGYTEKDIQDIKIAPTPSISGKEGRSIIGGWNLMVSKFSTKKEAAFKFIEFFLRYESQKKLFVSGGYVPTNINVYRNNIEYYNELKFYYNLLREKGLHRPYNESYTKISDNLSILIRNSIYKKIDPLIVAQQAKLELKGFLKREVIEIE